MVGQKYLLRKIDKQMYEKSFPRFSIIVGPRGSESDEIGPYVAEYLPANLITVTDVKVDTIRTIIQEAYKVATTTVYNIVEADGMSIQAQNSLLKVTEEPPNKAYFVMTLEDIYHTLPTIRSRGTVYSCDIYTQKELSDYAEEHYKDSRYIELCDTPGEVDILHSMGIDEFYGYVEKVVDNISIVGGSNAFKIADKIQFKDTDEKVYDLILFWKAFRQLCFNNEQYEKARTTSMCLNALRHKGLNKAMLFDKWLLAIRRIPDGDN